jgi:hypothetical protein
VVGTAGQPHLRPIRPVCLVSHLGMVKTLISRQRIGPLWLILGQSHQILRQSHRILGQSHQIQRQSHRMLGQYHQIQSQSHRILGHTEYLKVPPNTVRV